MPGSVVPRGSLLEQAMKEINRLTETGGENGRYYTNGVCDACFTGLSMLSAPELHARWREQYKTENG